MQPRDGHIRCERIERVCVSEVGWKGCALGKIWKTDIADVRYTIVGEKFCTGLPYLK